jgi:hypothetical protein
MIKIIYFSGLVAMIVSASAYADSFLRVKCDDKDIGAEVFINGKLVGNCPVDTLVQPGTVRLSARKIVNGDYEQLFAKELRVADGAPQRVELIMSAPQLTAKAKLQKESAEATTQLRAAETGDIAAMKKMADYYDAGTGVDKNPSKAKIWREKAETAAAQAQLRAANTGDIQAMEGMAARYESGRGVNKDNSQAQLWRDKASAAKREKVAQQQALAKQNKISSLSYTENNDKWIRANPPGPRGETLGPCTTWFSGLPFATISDLISAPTKTTEVKNIQNEAALRPSTWGKPDSMIARTSLQFKTSSYATENPLLVVTAK